MNFECHISQQPHRSFLLCELVWTSPPGTAPIQKGSTSEQASKVYSAHWSSPSLAWKFMDIILMKLRQERYCLEKCTHADHSFSSWWTNNTDVSFYSYILRQTAEKAALILILQSQRYTQQWLVLVRCTELAEPGVLWPGHSFMLCLGFSFLSHKASAQKRRIVNYGNCYHLCQRELNSVSCRSGYAIDYGNSNHMAYTGRSGHQSQPPWI